MTLQKAGMMSQITGMIPQKAEVISEKAEAICQKATMILEVWPGFLGKDGGESPERRDDLPEGGSTG